MPRFLALVRLSAPAVRDLDGSRAGFRVAERYLARRGITVQATFALDGAEHLLVLDAGESPTRYLNRALARAWPDPAERPGRARVVSAEPWVRRAAAPA